jgi:hypothetical protein
LKITNLGNKIKFFSINLAKPIKYLIKVDQNARSKYFDNVVQCLARVVPNSRIRIAETRENRGNQVTSVFLCFLLIVKDNDQTRLVIILQEKKQIVLFQERWHTQRDQ